MKHKKIGMVSPIYMVEQCLEKRPEFDLDYVTLSILGLVTKRHMKSEHNLH